MKTPAHLCVLHCRHQVVELLIGHGADPAATDSADNMPLDLATLMNEKYVILYLFFLNSNNIAFAYHYRGIFLFMGWGMGDIYVVKAVGMFLCRRALGL